jgi:hypothetical protein
MLPDTLLLQASKESLDDPILLGGAGGNELLGQPVVTASRTESATLEDHPVVAPDHRGCPRRPQGTKTGNTCLLDSPIGFLGPTAQGKLPALQLSIREVDHPNQIGPSRCGHTPRGSGLSPSGDRFSWCDSPRPSPAAEESPPADAPTTSWPSEYDNPFFRLILIPRR